MALIDTMKIVRHYNILITIIIQYYIVMGITTEIGNEWGWLGVAIGGTLTAISIVIPAVPIIVGAVGITAGMIAVLEGKQIAEGFNSEVLATTVRGDGIPNQFMVPTIVEAESGRLLKDGDEVALLPPFSGG